MVWPWEIVERDPGAIRDRHRASLAAYPEHERRLLGWAILVARKP